MTIAMFQRLLSNLVPSRPRQQDNSTVALTSDAALHYDRIFWIFCMSTKVELTGSNYVVQSRLDTGFTEKNSSMDQQEKVQLIENCWPVLLYNSLMFGDHLPDDALFYCLDSLEEKLTLNRNPWIEHIYSVTKFSGVSLSVCAHHLSAKSLLALRLSRSKYEALINEEISQIQDWYFAKVFN